MQNANYPLFFRRERIPVLKECEPCADYYEKFMKQKDEGRANKGGRVSIHVYLSADSPLA